VTSAANLATATGTYQFRAHSYSCSFVTYQLKVTKYGVPVSSYSGSIGGASPSTTGQFFSADTAWGPVLSVDLTGQSAILLGDRSLGLGSVYHYSIEYWTGVTNAIVGDQTSSATFIANNPTATRAGSIELLTPGQNLNAWVSTAADHCWKQITVGKSVLYLTSTATSYEPVFVDSQQNVADKWNELRAADYPYAETTDASVAKWPQSRYEIGDDDNNSNTFARWALTTSGISFNEMHLFHPGHLTPIPYDPTLYSGPPTATAQPLAQPPKNGWPQC